MLVLSRKAQQSIRIGDHITVNIVRIKGNVIQLGIDAPQDVHIVRSELLERDAANAANKKNCKQSSKDEAAGTPPLGMFAARSRAAGESEGATEEASHSDSSHSDSSHHAQILTAIRQAGQFPSCPNLNVVS